MRINPLLVNLCETFKEKLPELKRCEPHGGRFNPAEIKRIAVCAPALYLACAGAEQEQSEDYKFSLNLVAFIITSNSHRQTRTVSAIQLAESLTGFLIENTHWGKEEHISRPYKIRIDNLYGGNVDKMKVALWAVRWQQDIFIEPFSLANHSVDDFIRFHSDIDIPPHEDAATHEEFVKENYDNASPDAQDTQELPR